MSALASKAKQKLFARRRNGKRADRPLSDSSARDTSPEMAASTSASVMSQASNLKNMIMRNPFNRSHTTDTTSTERRTSYDPLVRTSNPNSADGSFVVDPKSTKSNKPPEGFTSYTAVEGDTLQKLAARFDTTPSVIKKINKLTMDFIFPGKVIFVPDKDYVQPEPTVAIDNTNLPSIHKDEKDVSPTTTYPGHVMRIESSCHSLNDLAANPQELSTDEAMFLDQECFERFIKINAWYIMDGTDSVDGTFLVTPNAVMFDPNPDHKLVIDRGADEFGMITTMDAVASISIYHKTSESKQSTDSEEVSSKETSSEIKLLTPTTEPSAVELLPSTDNPQTELTDPQPSKHQPSDPLLLNPSNLITLEQEMATPSALNQSEDRSSETNQSEKRSSATNQSEERNSAEGQTHHCDTVLCEYEFGADPKMRCGNSEFYLCRPLDDVETPDLAEYGIVVDVPKQNGKSQKNRRVRNTNLVSIHSAVSYEDKKEMFQSFEEMFPNGLAKKTTTSLVGQKTYSAADDVTMYLCLQVAPHLHALSNNQEAYSKKKRPEYWFQIPQNSMIIPTKQRVDQLYAFFKQWKPDRELSSSPCANVRFESATEHNELSDEKQIAQLNYHGEKIELTRDWEIVSRDEVLRRKNITDALQALPLPVLSTPSQIFNHDQIKQLTQALPARVEGYPWTLVFGSEQNGFSLSALYRCLLGIDSPVLLVIQTTDQMVFGALSSCAFRTSDLFYGTGESFLYTFVETFKVFHWTGTNNFFNKGDTQCMSIGAGAGSYGIWLDGDLFHGRTQNCQTFANDPLTGTNGSEDFEIQSIEVWSFHDF